MRISRTVFLIIIVFVPLWSFSAIDAQQSRPGDLNDDYIIDAQDLILFAEQWLDPSGCSGPGCADFDGENGVNMADFASLAENWQKQYDRLVISEFMASNNKILLDGDLESSDWIEIYNPADVEISLDGWFLTDDSENLKKWPFPEGITLKGGRYFLVFASGQDVNDYVDPEGNYHTNFKLSSDGEYLALVRPDGAVVHDYNNYQISDDEFGYPPQYTDISYGIDLNEQVLVANRAWSRAFIPQDDSLGIEWTENDFLPAGWLYWFTGIGYAPPIEIEKAGQLFVDLRYRDFTAPGWLYQWNNHGTLGGYFHNDSTKIWLWSPDIYLSAKFDGTNHMKSTFTAPAGITTNSDWSVEMWVYNPTISSREAIVQWTDNIGSIDGRLSIFGYGTSGSSGAMIHNGSTDIGYDSGVPEAEKWHHITATYEGGTNGTERIYVDGKLNASEQKSLDLYTNDYLMLGSAGGELNYTGALAAVRIHDGVLTEEQVYNNFLTDANHFNVILPEDLEYLSPLINLYIKPQMYNVNSSAYIRINFEVPDPNLLSDTLMLNIYYDDGFIAYINGTEVARRNAPENPAWNSSATAERTEAISTTAETIDISNYRYLLQEGTNLLAIHGLNSSINDDDFLILPTLRSLSLDFESYKNWYFAKPTPRCANNAAFIDYVDDVRFSVDRGFYDEPFQIRMATDTDGAVIRYTTDGSAPTETNGTIYDPNNPIQITKTTCLRAAAFKSSYKASNVDTQTYIFLDNVINQPYFPEGFPTSWGSLTPDYEVDPDVVDIPEYSATFKDDLKTIPSLCIGIDNDDFFGAENGIYANPYQRGDAWEREASIEIVDPCTGKYIQVNAGLRVHGGYARTQNVAKQSLRMLFKSMYGPSKLNFPLFKDSEVESFDQLVLRATWNYSWTGDSGGHTERAQYMRELYAHDVIRDMDRLQNFGRHVHLYINGLYWGLYILTERPDDGFAEEHLGGDKSDYDVIKTDAQYWTDPNVIELLAGDRQTWDQLFVLAEVDLSTPQNYAAIQEYVDIPAMIDYMLMIFHTGSRDAPVLIGNDRAPRNFYAIRKRQPGAGFVFIPWDVEWSLEDTGVDRVNVFNYINGYENPAYLTERLKANEEFRLLVADRVHKYFFNNAQLTEQKTIDRYWNRVMDIDRAIVGESARWGDAKYPYNPPYTRNDEWITERNRLINYYFPVRRDIVLSQLRDGDLYPDLDAPEYKVNSVFQHGGYISTSDDITMDSNSSGTIYYTTDDSDPREPLTGNPVGTTYTGSFNIPSTKNIKARLKDGSTWSALCEAVFAVGPVADNLRITEIMYHPREWPPVDPNAEFIELRNIGLESINLNLVKFTNGIQFTFPDVTLEANQYIVVVKDINAFEAEYGTGINIVGEYEGALDNAGERIRLADALGNTILDFEFKDGWRSITDGEGYSLIINDEFNPDPNSWCEKDCWSASIAQGGSPGMDDNGPRHGDIVINEILAHSHELAPDWIELHNTTDESINIGGWFLSDNDSNLTKYEIAEGTEIPANDYIVFYEDTNFGPLSSDPGAHVPFALSEAGEEVCLSSGLAGQPTGYRNKEDFGASETGVAFGRYYKESTDNYNFVAMSENTPLLPNAYPKVSPVVISEIMYHPEIFWGNWEAEYIELCNISDDTVNLYDVNGISWKFTDGIEFTFPPYTSMPPKSTLLVVRDPNIVLAEFNDVPPSAQIFQWESGRLDNGGERIEISAPGDYDENDDLQYIRIDRVNYSDGSHPEDFDGVTDPWPTEADGTGKSLERVNLELYGNDPNNWDANTPTPGIIPGFEWTLLSYDNFEDSWGNYTDGGDDCILYPGGTYSHQGNYAANIQDDKGDASAFWHTNGIDVDSPGYTQIKVDFWFYADNMDEGEYFIVRFFDGSAWQTVSIYVCGTDFENGSFYPVTLYIDEGVYNFPSDMKLKFECVAGNTHKIYIDEITVYAK